MELALLGCIVEIDRKARSRRMWHATYFTSCDQSDKIVIVALVRWGPEQSIYVLLTTCHKPILVLYFNIFTLIWFWRFRDLMTWGFLLANIAAGSRTRQWNEVHYWNVSSGSGIQNACESDRKSCQQGIKIFWGLGKCGMWFRQVSVRAWMQC